MKRLIAFVALGALLVGTLALGKTYSRYHGEAIAASANTYIVPTYNGVAFRGEFMQLFTSSADGVKGIAVTMFLPLNMGPDGATDSFTVYFDTEKYTGGIFNYAGPISDTLHVVADASTAGSIHIYD